MTRPSIKLVNDCYIFYKCATILNNRIGLNIWVHSPIMCVSREFLFRQVRVMRRFEIELSSSGLVESTCGLDAICMRASA